MQHVFQYVCRCIFNLLIYDNNAQYKPPNTSWLNTSWIFFQERTLWTACVYIFTKNSIVRKFLHPITLTATAILGVTHQHRHPCMLYCRFINILCEWEVIQRTSKIAYFSPKFPNPGYIVLVGEYYLSHLADVALDESQYFWACYHVNMIIFGRIWSNIGWSNLKMYYKNRLWTGNIWTFENVYRNIINMYANDIFILSNLHFILFAVETVYNLFTIKECNIS